MNIEATAQDLFSKADTMGIVITLHTHFKCPLQVTLPFSQTICDTSIDELDLSVRSQNCLKRANIMTVGQLIEIAGTDEMLKLRNLGKKSLCEIKTRLLAFGYDKLGDFGKLQFWQEFLQHNQII